MGCGLIAPNTQSRVWTHSTGGKDAEEHLPMHRLEIKNLCQLRAKYVENDDETLAFQSAHHLDWAYGYSTTAYTIAKKTSRIKINLCVYDMMPYDSNCSNGDFGLPTVLLFKSLHPCKHVYEQNQK
eukprot:6181300-Pleurochrysis_carterae.AAC.3